MVGLGCRHVKFGEWLHSQLALRTPEDVKGFIYPSGHANKEAGVSPSLNDGNVSGVVIPDAMKGTTSSVFLNDGGGSADLDLNVKTLFQVKRANHRVSWKEKGSCMSNGNLLIADGGKRLSKEIEDTSTLSCAPSDTGQYTHLRIKLCFVRFYLVSISFWFLFW